LADRLGNLATAVAGVAAPKAGSAVQYLATIAAGVIHAGGALQQSWLGLELAIGGEGHPKLSETVVFIERIRHKATGHFIHQGKRNRRLCAGCGGVYV
jgi:hypothetical protein